MEAIYLNNFLIADAHVIGDEETHRVNSQGDDEEYELVRPGVNGETTNGAERPGSTSECEADGILEQQRCSGVSDQFRVRRRILRRLDGIAVKRADIRQRRRRQRCPQAGAALAHHDREG